MRKTTCFLLLAACCLAPASSSLMGQQAETPFPQPLQDVLKRHCGACHAGEKRVVEGFNLDDVATLENRGYVSRKSLAESVIWKRVERGEMPPPRAGSLSQQEQTTLKTGLGQIVMTGPAREPNPPRPPDESPVLSIEETLVQDKERRFTLLLEWAEHCGIASELRGAGPYTILAPTNEAIKALGAQSLLYLTKEANKSVLTRLLFNHSLAKIGRISTDELLELGKFPTLHRGAQLDVRKYQRDTWIGDAKVVQKNIDCKNGMIHIVDKVLVPPQLKLPDSNSRDIVEPFGIIMGVVDEGQFLMGSALGVGIDDEWPQHRVELSSFLMSRFEITGTQFNQIMGFNPSDKDIPLYRENPKGQPVQDVTWYQAAEFCNQLSQLCKIPVYYSLKQNAEDYCVEIPDPAGVGFRLPSEAEWEYVCRAGTTSKWEFGDNEGLAQNRAWIDDIDKKVHPVGKMPANAWGFFDMHGNVAEWCEDWYAPYSKGNANTRGPAKGKDRVIRGGSYVYPAEDARSAARTSRPPGYRHRSIGFRIVRSLSPVDPIVESGFPNARE